MNVIYCGVVVICHSVLPFFGILAHPTLPGLPQQMLARVLYKRELNTLNSLSFLIFVLILV